MPRMMTALGNMAALAEPGGVDFRSIYDENLRLIVGTAIRHYRICETDAEALAHEVFLAYFLKANEVLDPRAWLLSAINNASKHYLRRRARQVALPPEYEQTAAGPGEAVAERLMAREIICCVSARCQLALRLRYVEGYSIRELAVELDTTAKYARKLVGRCVRQAKQRYAAKGER